MSSVFRKTVKTQTLNIAIDSPTAMSRFIERKRVAHLHYAVFSLYSR
jgi:hypothetical protein